MPVRAALCWDTQFLCNICCGLPRRVRCTLLPSTGAWRAPNSSYTCLCKTGSMCPRILGFSYNIRRSPMICRMGASCILMLFFPPSISGASHRCSSSTRHILAGASNMLLCRYKECIRCLHKSTNARCVSLCNRVHKYSSWNIGHVSSSTYHGPEFRRTAGWYTLHGCVDIRCFQCTRWGMS